MAFLDSVRRWLGRKEPATGSRDPAFMGEALVYNLLINRFGLKDEDFSALTAALPPELQTVARAWILIYGCWLFRIALLEKYGQSFLQAALVSARRRLERKIEEFDGTRLVQALEFWFGKLDDATSGLGTKFKGYELPMEVFAAWSFLALDADSPFFGKSEVPNQLDLAVADCLEKAKSAVMGGIKFTVEVGRPLPADPKEVTAISQAALAAIARSARELSWSFDPGPEERHLRRRHGNVLFPLARRVVTQDDVDSARERDRVSLSNLTTDLQRTLDQVVALPPTVPMRECHQILQQLDGLKARCIAHSSTETSHWMDGLDKGITAAAEVMRQGFAANPEGLQQFDEWRRLTDEQSHNAGVLEVLDLPEEDIVPAACSLTPMGIDTLLRALASDKEATDVMRTSCVTVLRNAVAEGYPPDEAAARLSVLKGGHSEEE
jgi:hypothetical protein